MTLRTTRSLPVLTALVFTLAAAPVVAMPVYKCVAADGKVTYSQNPCYGDQWHRLGEARAPRKPNSDAGAPATTAQKAAGSGAAATSPSSAAAGAPAPAAATSATAAAATPTPSASRP